MRRVRSIFAALLFAGLVTPAALADEGPVVQPNPALPAAEAPEATWPDALRHRNARYAVLARSLDREGDRHEALLAKAYTDRTHDLAGDREVARRSRAAQRGHWGAVHARLQRTQDDPGDARERILARLSNARKHAAFARVRFPKVLVDGQWVYDDAQELKLYKQRLLEFGDANERVAMAEERHDPRAVDRLVQRQDNRDTSTTDREERLIDRADERAMAVSDRDRAREIERQEEAEEGDLEDLERDLESEDEAAMEGLEGELDRVEAGEERASEREEERALDSEVEQALQQEEGVEGL